MKAQIKKSLAIITFTLFITLFAFCLFSCSPELYTVTFDSNGGSSVEAQTIEEGKNATKPEAPTKEGYNFIGWYMGDEEWSFVGFTVNQDITLKAKWEKKTYTVTFDANGGNGSTEKTAEHGKTVTAPMVTKPKHSLIGWFNGDTQWNFKTDTVTSDITLVAKWEAFPQTITFNANGGTVSEEERTVLYGSEIGNLPTPERFLYVFVGWYEESDVNFENKISETTIVNDKMSLKARWEIDDTLISIEFDANGGTVAKDVVYIDKGTTLGSLLVDPTRDDGATFNGWYDAKNNRITKTTKISSSIVVTAKWIEPTICTNGTSKHNWSLWDYDTYASTCTEDGKAVRLCQDCGHREEKIGTEKLGHDYATGWTYGTMQQSRICARCTREQVVYYTSLSDKINKTTITGNVFGAENVDCLYNGIWDETTDTFCGKGGSVAVDIEFTSPTFVDLVYIKGTGEYSYTLSVLYEGDTEYTLIGTDTFGESVACFVIGKTITNARISMENGGNLDGYWQEIAFAKIPE